MNKIRDISDNLEKNIDISKSYKPRKIKLSDVIKKTVNDIRKNLRETVDISSSKYAKVFQNKTKNSDSLIKDKRLKDINLIEEKSVLQKLTQRNIFDKRKIFTKKFLKKSLLLFLVVLIIFIISAGLAKHFINSGYTKLLSISNNTSDVIEIRKSLKKARFDFVASSFLFKPLFLIPNENIKNGNHIIKGGRDLVVLGDRLLAYYSYILSLIDTQGIDNIIVTDILKQSKETFYDFAYMLSNVIYSYEQIGYLGDDELQNKFIYGKKFLQFAYNSITILNRNFDTFLNMLGEKEERKYMILLQNNDEIRPTGGFIGSVGMIKIYKGKIVSLDFEDTYSYEWNIDKIYKDKILAPKGINRVTKYLGLRDANYKIDFSDSSKEIKFFTDKIDKEIDGIVYINQSIILDILKITGPIEMELDYSGRTRSQEINEMNFSEVISTLVEAKTFKVGTLGTPKKILFDFSEILFSKLKEEKKYSQYAKVLIDNISSRDIVVNSFHPEENSLLWKLGLSGDINYSETLDYTYPVYTSIGGGKTDRYYKREYRKIVNTNLDCSIDTRLEITGFHLFTQRKEDQILKLINKYNVVDKNVLFIQGKADNKSYVRILLPKEAIIKDTKYIDIFQLENHKLVEFYTTTRRLEKVFHTIEYTLPNGSCKDYDFTLYKQPGIRTYDIEIEKDGIMTKKYGMEEDYYYNSKK